MRTILITGASDGIGKSIAIACSKQHDRLVLFGRDAEKLDAVRQVCEANGSKVATHAFDLTDSVMLQDAVDQVLGTGPVDVLINNAGIWHKTGDLTSLSEETIQGVIATNLTAQILLTHKLLDQMRTRPGTAIINVISKSGVTAQAGQSVYTASKYGMRGFTDVLREDTKNEPVRVGAVYQSGTDTEMFRKAGEDFDTSKLTDPNDLAEVVLFMLTRPKRIWLNEVRVTY